MDTLSEINKRGHLLLCIISLLSVYYQSIVHKIYYRNNHCKAMSFKATDEYIEMLNKAVMAEFQSSIQYFLQHAKMEKILRKVKPENYLLEETTYDKIGEVLKKASIDEMRHAAMIMERIYYLGGEVKAKPYKPEIGDTFKDFMHLGMKRENEALKLYREIKKNALELGDWETKKMFEKIYSEEEEHYYRFEEFKDVDDSEPEGPEPKPTKWREKIDEEYFALLNKALAMELTAIIQYVTQHEKANYLALRKRETPLEIIKDKNKAKVVGDMLKAFSMEEMEHYEMIAERIYLMEGECVVAPDPIPKIGDTVDDFLILDHKAEDEAIVLYNKIIKEAMERGDLKTKLIFEKITEDEDRHYWELDDFF